MVRQIISIVLLLFCFIANAQQYIGKEGEISFFSEAPLENISAVNKKVAAAYDVKTKEIVFQLYIQDFIFPNPLMQEHFNENYMESEIYPKSIFIGKVLEYRNNKAQVEGELTIHGETNKIKAKGIMIKDEKSYNIASIFIVKLEDYKIKIPKIVMYNIAEEIEVNVNIELVELK